MGDCALVGVSARVVLVSVLVVVVCLPCFIFANITYEKRESNGSNRRRRSTSRGDMTIAEPKCWGNWKRVRTKCCLFVQEEKLSWDDANTSCIYRGARLVSIESSEERTAIRRELRKLVGRDQTMWWVGLRHVGNGEWRWVNGQNFDFHVVPWEEGEPSNDQGHEECGELWSQRAKLNNKECNEPRPFICEKTLSAPERGGSGQNSQPDPTTTITTTTTASEDDDKEGNDDGEEEKFKGCFFPKGTKKKGGKSFYTPRSNLCPGVKVANTTWPKTEAGEVRNQPCPRRNAGNMTFECEKTRACWWGRPNRDQCANKAFRNLLSKYSSEDDDVTAPDPEETLAVTSELANITTGDDITEEEVIATSKLIKGLFRRGAAGRIKDRKTVKRVVVNVVRAGSNLVSRNKTAVWKRMAREDKIRSATSLLVAMETATVAMAEELVEPTTIASRDDNIDLQVRVVNVTSQGGGKEEVVYKADDSPSRFSIPLTTLQHLSPDGLARMVFMTHFTMHDVLDDVTDDDTEDQLSKGDDDDGDDQADDDEETGDDPAPQMASYVVSASVASGQSTNQLPEPVTFTIRHFRKIPKGFQSLCAFWSISESTGLGAWSQEGCGRVEGGSNDTHTQCQCDHLTNFAVLMAVRKVQVSEEHNTSLRVVTIVGCVISCLCLLASWITFTCVSSLQGERNSIHKNLVACLFLAELLFLIGIDRTENRAVCGVMAGFLHYFFLATFCWMLMEAVHIMLMLVQVFDASRSRLPYYYTAAYAPPLLIVAISAGVYSQGYGTDHYCWLTTERGFIWSFTGPVVAILIVNSVVLFYAMTMVCRHSDHVFSNKDKTSAGSIRSWIQGAMALEVLLGLTWILGLFFMDQQSLAVAYLFTILNSTQGLFIFVFHCLLNNKARKEYRRVMKLARQPSTTGTGTGTNTHSGTNTGTHSASLAKNKLSSGLSFNQHDKSQSTAPTYL